MTFAERRHWKLQDVSPLVLKNMNSSIFKSLATAKEEYQNHLYMGYVDCGLQHTIDNGTECNESQTLAVFSSLELFTLFMSFHSFISSKVCQSLLKLIVETELPQARDRYKN